MLVRFLTSNALQIAAPAKVNLYLELLGKRPDGFHELETIMTTVSLFDQLHFKTNSTGSVRLRIQMAASAPAASGVSGGSSEQQIPTDQRNLVVKSLRLLQKMAGDSSRWQNDGQTKDLPPPRTAPNTGGSIGGQGMDVTLLKRIPSSAGLGGASSNAAAALIAGNLLWNLGLPVASLHAAAAEIGSDVPFFLTGGTAMCRGRGEKISSISCPVGLSIVIAKPPQGLATPDVFGRCELPIRSRQSQPVIAGIESGRQHEIANFMLNRLQPAASGLLDDILLLEKEFADISCLGHQMSGSGSSYFGVFQNQRTARIAVARLSARRPDLEIHCVKSLGRSGALIA